MRQFIIRYMLYLVIASVLLAPGWAAAQFEDCDSARNNGSNIARTAVSSAFNQMACVENALGATEGALAMVFSQTPAQTNANPLLQACWFLGYHQGAMTQLIIEYGQCDTENGAMESALACISVDSIALLSASIFTSLYNTMPTALTPEFIEDVFQLRPSNTCTFGDEAELSCQMKVTEVVQSGLGALSPAQRPLVDALNAQVCLEPVVQPQP